MKTESVNSLAEQFEVDRGTMVKALRNVPPDAAKTPNRPQWKISTAARALEAHRRSVGRVDSRRPVVRTSEAVDPDWQDPILVAAYKELDAADAAMRKLSTIVARRKAARAMGPLINRVDLLTRQRGKANGQLEELVDLRADNMMLLTMRGLEGPCSWVLDECWCVVNEAA
jgi:hypothetical protein